MKVFALISGLFFLAACAGDTPAKNGASVAAVPASPLDTLRLLARPGDLVFRLGDDMMSYSIRFLSESDPSYSHTGLIDRRNGKLVVLHIAPGHGDDRITAEPIDSFLNPAVNLGGGLYRYRLSEPELQRFLGQVRRFETRGVTFDYRYDLRSNDSLYCSELIGKSLDSATAGRIRFRAKPIAKSMRPLMRAYFSTLITDTGIVYTRPYLPLDALYRHPECDSIYKFSLH